MKKEERQCSYLHSKMTRFEHAVNNVYALQVKCLFESDGYAEPFGYLTVAMTAKYMRLCLSEYRTLKGDEWIAYGVIAYYLSLQAAGTDVCGSYNHVTSAMYNVHYFFRTQCFCAPCWHDQHVKYVCIRHRE